MAMMNNVVRASVNTLLGILADRQFFAVAAKDLQEHTLVLNTGKTVTMVIVNKAEAVLLVDKQDLPPLVNNPTCWIDRGDLSLYDGFSITANELQNLTEKVARSGIKPEFKSH